MTSSGTGVDPTRFPQGKKGQKGSTCQEKTQNPSSKDSPIFPCRRHFYSMRASHVSQWAHGCSGMPRPFLKVT